MPLTNPTIVPRSGNTTIFIALTDSTVVTTQQKTTSFMPVTNPTIIGSHAAKKQRVSCEVQTLQSVVLTLQKNNVP